MVLELLNKYVKSFDVYLRHDKDISYTCNMNWTNKLEKLEQILSV